MAIIGNVSIYTTDGTTLTGSSDLDLAWQWAEYEHGPEAWQAMSYPAKVVTVRDALLELRRAYAGAEL